MKKNIINVIVSLMLLGISAFVFASKVNEDPLEREVLDIAEKLRCTVCQNQPVAESNSGLAKDMRAVIKEKLQQGNNEQQIVQYFVDRYGDYVLLEPPQSGNGMAIWIFPPLLLLLAMAAAIMMMKSRSEKKSVTPAPTLSEADKERIRRARSEDNENDESGENK